MKLSREISVIKHRPVNGIDHIGGLWIITAKDLLIPIEIEGRRRPVESKIKNLPMLPFEIFRIDAMRCMGGPQDDHIGIHLRMENFLIMERIMGTGLKIHPSVHQD
jgi:hypothetical protein